MLAMHAPQPALPACLLPGQQPVWSSGWRRHVSLPGGLAPNIGIGLLS